MKLSCGEISGPVPQTDCTHCRSWPLSSNSADSPENVLTTISGSDETQRLLLCSVQCETNGSCVELQRQSWSDSIGWFTQSRIRIAKDEINFLRAALGGVSARSIIMAENDAEPASILRFPKQHSA